MNMSGCVDHVTAGVWEVVDRDLTLISGDYLSDTNNTTIYEYHLENISKGSNAR